MPRIGLSTYALRVASVGAPDDYQVLDKLGSGLDFCDICQRYLNQRKALHADDATEQTVLKTKQLRVKERVISGTIDQGGYGRVKDVINRVTGTVTHRMGKDDADLSPLYFRFEIPRGANEGIVILQKVGSRSMKSALERDFNSWLKLNLPFRVKISPLTPAQVWDRFLEPGRITKLRLVYFGASSDRADMYLKEHIENAQEMEVVYKSGFRKGLGIKDRLGRLFRARTEPGTPIHVTELLELQDPEYCTAKIEFAIGKGRYTMDLWNPDDISIPYDVTKVVHIGSDGHPDFDSIDLLADQMQQDTRRTLSKGEDVH